MADDPTPMPEGNVDGPVRGSEGNPRVVALMPAWNAALFIEETLDSIAAQTYPNFHVLISNDASTDETGAICDRYAAKDPRFHVIHQPENLGWIGNVNALFREAEGDYFFFAFHDDLLKPGFVEKTVDALRSHPEAILAYPDIELVDLEGNTTRPTFSAVDGVTDRYERVAIMARAYPYWWIPNRGLFKAEAPGLVGGLHRNLAGEFAADWRWLFSLSVHGTFVRVPEILARKIFKEKSVSIVWKNNPLSRAAAILSCGGVVLSGPFSRLEKLRLNATLVGTFRLRAWFTVRNWLSKWPFLRRVYARFRSDRPDTR